MGTMGKNVLPLALVMLVLLVVVTGFSATQGLHLQDGIYTLGVDNAAVGEIFSPDVRFTVYQADDATLWNSREYFDAIVIGGEVWGSDTDKGRAAVRALQTDYEGYLNQVYAQESDLFAAYPLWIDVQNIRSELDFTATLAGQQVAAPIRQSRPPVPSGPIIDIATPAPTLGIPMSEIRQGLVQSQGSSSQITRYSELLTGESPFGDYTIPSQLTPPLPFDTIILVFVFIFPLYFTSQFFMMSIMNERLERKGEVLLTTPLHPAAIILGKGLPYFLLMLAISTLLILWLGASLSILLPLLPVILFFLASALIIGMISRSFKELSFLSIFFSTVATAYLFFPSIFANVHIISLISPLTLVVLTLQGEPYTAVQYIYSTSLFYLTSAVLFYLALVNFREDRLFSQVGLSEKFQDFISTALSRKRPYVSLFILNALLIPFVFMAQMMVLVLFFNLPVPLSLVLLLVFAAFIEEFAKSIGILSLHHRDSSFLSWKRLVFASIATAAGFLFGEKLLTFLTLSQITESVFGSILFLSLGALWLPFLLHFSGVLIVGTGLKLKGRAGYIAGLMVATLVHCLYNLYFILGVLSL